MKILIVEDDPASRKFLKDTVEAEGHESRVAENGEVGLKVFKQFAPDMVLSDIQMPLVNGLELLEAIRLHNSSSIVIMATAYGSEEYAMRALRLGANNYLKKPIRHAELIPLLKKYDSINRPIRLEQEILEQVVEKKLYMKVDNRFELIPRIVDYLVRETGAAIPEKKRFGVRLGLLELLTNAIEHGNLEINYDEKSEALESGKLDSLYEQRLADSSLSERKIAVAFKMDGTSCEWQITDEGKGFDWRTLMDSFDESRLLESHGRGILISQLYFEELKYNDAGNSVHVIKKLT